MQRGKDNFVVLKSINYKPQIVSEIIVVCDNIKLPISKCINKGGSIYKKNLSAVVL